MTTDNHVVHEVDGGINPLGERMPTDASIRGATEAVRAALADLGPVEVRFGSRDVPAVPTLGPGFTARLLTSLGDTLTMFQNMVVATFLLLLTGSLSWSSPSTRGRPLVSSTTAGDASRLLGEEGLRLLTQLVATAPTNLEAPGQGRWEKPNYLRTSDAIVRAARARGLSTRIYDPMTSGDVPGDWHGLPRPNVVADLDVGAPETVLILAHYDVVPCPPSSWPAGRARPIRSPPAATAAFTLEARTTTSVAGWSAR